MKNNKLFRLLALTLTLAMLLPCVFTTSLAADGPVEMYHFVASSVVTENIKALSSNNINTMGDKYPQMARPAYVMTKYTPDGAVTTPTTGFTEGVTVSSTYGTYGLPFSDSNSMGKRLTENLMVVTEKMPPIVTRGKEVVNVEMEYAFRASTAARNVAFDDMMRVFVSLDGETWLEDSVGMRCAVVDAPGLDHQGKPVVFYKIQTENLLDIEGVERGDRIHKIKIMPDGLDNRVQTGHFIISELKVNGYSKREQFEQLHPVRKQFQYVDPDILRQIVLDEGIRTATVEWTTDYNIYTCSPGGSSTLGGTGTVHEYSKDYTWWGPVYERNSDAFRERHQAGIVDGKHVAGYAGDLALGMDCQTFAYNAVSRVSRTNANGVLYWLGASGARFIDGIKRADRPTWTDTDVKPYNTEQEMYEAYAKCKTGDVAVVYVTAGGVHVRVVNRVEVVRNPDGTINGEKSIMYNTETTSGKSFEVRMADGSQVRLNGMDDAALERFLAENPGSELLHVLSAFVDNEATFATMYNGSYCVFTLNVYDDGMVELEDTQAVFVPKDGKDFSASGAAIGFASNYTIIGYNVKLEDVGTGAVLFDYHTYMPNQATRCYSYESAQLDAVLKNLTNGNYRLSIDVEAGPFTQLGQSRAPITTKSVDFTVTDKPASSQVSLEIPDAAENGEVTVSVNVSAPYDAADVEVKFDADQLTYVSGTVVPESLLKTIVQDKGVLRIACVDAKASAGTLATLTFKAKDAAAAKDAILLKNAVVTTASAANEGNADKAADPELCASVNMADVAPTAWYHNAVDYAMNNGIMGGYDETTFAPNDELSRAMVMQVLYNKEGKPAVGGEHSFSDVKGNDWFSKAVTWGFGKGLVEGYGDGRFAPGDSVTLEQIAVILWNYSGKPEGGDDLSDIGAHSVWAEEALRWAEDEDILSGVPYDTVTAAATRAQTAQMLMNFLNK